MRERMMLQTGMAIYSQCKDSRPNDHVFVAVLLLE